MITYEQQVRSSGDLINLDFWRKPEGVRVPDDELDFLLIPDEVESKRRGDRANPGIEWGFQ